MKGDAGEPVCAVRFWEGRNEGATISILIETERPIPTA